MNDKLPLLKKLAVSKGVKIEDIRDQIQDPDNEELKNYMLAVSVAQEYIRSLEANTKKLVKIQNELIHAIGEKEKQYTIEIDKIIDSSLFIQQKIKIVIKSNSELLSNIENNSELLEQEKRIIKNLYGSLIKSFQDTVDEYQKAQSDIKKIKHHQTVRNAEIIAGRSLHETEIENVINDPNLVKDMFKSKLTSSKFSNVISDIEDRHNDIVKLEKSVNQVHQLFLELAALVSLQGEIVDNIYENIEKAKKDVFSAEDDVIQTKKNMISARKKKCCILICAVVVIIIICSSVLGIKLKSA